jgi:2-polyprenyl-3-methyl-5-hydroxy-6-metoxy-1,4-benzoquinol methylase
LAVVLAVTQSCFLSATLSAIWRAPTAGGALAPILKRRFEQVTATRSSPVGKTERLMVTSDERETAKRFSERYRVGQTDVTRRIELAVIGGTWGANGYTTVAQADRLAVVLGLGPGVGLLDVGAGRGWPGLYLAASTGCRVVLSDVPAEAVATAAGRARHEGLAPRAVAIVASARHLPFTPASFDAVVHTDVLC